MLDFGMLSLLRGRLVVLLKVKLSFKIQYLNRILWKKKNSFHSEVSINGNRFSCSSNFFFFFNAFSIYFLICLATDLEHVINNSLSIASSAADITSVFKTSLFPLMPSVLHPLCQIVLIWDIWKVLYLVRILLINYFPEYYCLCNYKWAT